MMVEAWKGKIFGCETVSAIGKEIQIATAIVNIGELYTYPKDVMVVDLSEWESQAAEIARLNLVIQQAQQLCGMWISGDHVFVSPSTEGNWTLAPELSSHIDQLTKQSSGK